MYIVSVHCTTVQPSPDKPVCHLSPQGSRIFSSWWTTTQCGCVRPYSHNISHGRLILGIYIQQKFSETIKNMSSNVYTSTPRPVLSKSTSKALLSSKISIPRVLSYQCDECGHRISRVSSYPEAYGNEAWESYRLSRPHSLYSDRDYGSQKVNNQNQ